MKNSLSLSLLFLVFTAAPAPAQNLWPVSFSYWCSYPDRYMPDLLGADHSMAHAESDGRSGRSPAPRPHAKPQPGDEPA